MKTRDPDRTVIQRIQRSRPSERAELFALLYTRHRESIFAVCRRRTPNEEDALDALQETFFAAASQFDRFRGEARFSTWLHRIAFNKCGEIRRRRRRSLRLEDAVASPRNGESTLPSVADDGPLPSEIASTSERDIRVREVVGALPSWLRVAVQLRYFEDLPYEEIAAVLGVPVGTVKSRLFRAHRALARQLEPMAIPA